MLEVSGLSVSYGAHRALEDVSIRVDKGEICVILGANGAGKSTLLKAVAGLVPAQNGSRIAVAGRPVGNAPPNRIVEAGLALVPEGRGIFGDLSVAENLSLGAYGRQARSSEKRRLADVIELFPRLAERKGQVARTMSGGEQQMVAIGRALMSAPSILMLDEPSLGLSPLLTRDLFRSLKAVRETGVGILMVEQNARQSLAIADRGYLLENGHITGEGRAGELVNDPAVQAAYLGGAAAATSPRSGRRPRGYVNGHSVAFGAGSSKGEPIDMNRQAHELSEQAAAMAARAATIQRHYVETLRGPPASFEPLAEPNRGSDTPEALAARAAAIHRDYVQRGRTDIAASRVGLSLSSLVDTSELTKAQKKMLKKARKAARRAQKLADKVLREIG